jgi:hypothetical protein
MRERAPSAFAGAAKLAAPAAERTRDDGARGRTEPLPVSEWIALIRKLRDDGHPDDAQRQLTAFRAAHPDHERLLPSDLREWSPGGR